MSGLFVRFHVAEEVKVERELKVSLNRLEVLLALDKHQRQEIVMHSLVQVCMEVINCRLQCLGFHFFNV